MKKILSSIKKGIKAYFTVLVSTNALLPTGTFPIGN